MKIKFGWISRLWRTKKEIQDETMQRVKPIYPTQKPVELISIAIKNSSKAQDNVVDLFGGSGSTMVTAHQMRRNTYTLELDPKYVQVMVDRMRALDPLIDIFRNGEPY